MLCLISFNSFTFAESDFNFVQITDTHWGNDDNLSRTEKAIAAINNLPIPVRFVVHTGDITNHNIKDRKVIKSGLAIMKICKYPVYYVPGNNDIAEDKFEKQSELFTSYFGNINNRIDVEDISIITLYNLEIKDSSGNYTYDPILKLDSLLKKKPDSLPAIVFQHCPTTEDFYANASHKGWSKERVDEFRSICEKYNVKAVITGHFHRDELHWIGNIPLFVASPIAGKHGRQPSFRVYHYQNGQISYFTCYY
jgi:3',5'-cyclic AMP phosphodiesterase CpdA